MLKVTILLACLAAVTIHGCLITNCPRGGKRGGNVASLEGIARECLSCGPNHLGQCFGPHICCGPRIGCFIGTPETYKCRKESLLSRPCIAGFAMCRGSTARCAADGICCSQGDRNMQSTTSSASGRIWRSTIPFWNKEPSSFPFRETQSCHVDSACKLLDTINNSRKIDAEISVALPENEVSNEVLL